MPHSLLRPGRQRPLRPHAKSRPEGGVPGHAPGWCLAEIAREMEEATNRLQDRPSGEHGKVVRNRFVMHNAPVIAGTRIPTSAIYDLHTAGCTPAEIIKDYPRLTEADVVEAIAWEEIRRNERAAS